MKQRRSLLEGVSQTNTIDPELEAEFVFSKKRTNETLPTPEPATPQEAKVQDHLERAGKTLARVPLTTRVRADYANALKRASLQRQLDTVFPNSLQDILEEALEPWLRKHGYLAKGEGA